MTRLPAWRVALAALILGILAIVLLVCAPYYFRNLTLQNYVAGLTRGVEGRARQDAEIRDLVLQKAQTLRLPVAAGNVQVMRQADGSVKKIDVRYVVPVNLPGYTVTLHFYPGAGSR